MFNLSAKQDGIHLRTPSQLEQKQGFGKRFAEVMGIATDARDAAEDAKNLVKSLDDDLTSEEIYNRLTNNGQIQGLFRDDDGNLYVNGEYIVALEKLFAKDITMSGKLTYTTKTFLNPGNEEIETIKKHLLGKEIIPTNKLPLYDFNNDGQITIVDLGIANAAYLGDYSLADNWSGAVKTDVTITIDLANPEKAFRITGTNMWGREVDSYLGINDTNILNSETEKRLKDIEDTLTIDYIEEQGTGLGWIYEKWHSGICKLYRNVSVVPYSTGTIHYTVDYPFELKSEPIIIPHITQNYSVCREVYPSNAAGNYTDVTNRLDLLFCNVSTTSYSIYASVQVISAWKYGGE